MEICGHDADFTVGWGGSALLCRVGADAVIAVMVWLIAFEESFCGICAL